MTLSISGWEKQFGASMLNTIFFCLPGKIHAAGSAGTNQSVTWHEKHLVETDGNKNDHKKALLFCHLLASLTIKDN